MEIRDVRHPKHDISAFCAAFRGDRRQSLLIAPQEA
jgi:hypothetical protein